MLILEEHNRNKDQHPPQVGLDCDGFKMGERGTPGPVKDSSIIKMHHCPFCPYTTPSKTSLTNHIRTHTGEKPYCYNLKRHIFIHIGEKPFACAHCQYRATQKGALKFHVLSHHSA
ncbi:gastrula zinc finger protein XlCGF64.1-like [Penaeus vannamei]|uniref:gastrula zinc finger protein XlCGF64.1-like n=1 Tax=Penaeus vannamei TaxID=6689 RepID=UPI00387F6563